MNGCIKRVDRCVDDGIEVVSSYIHEGVNSGVNSKCVRGGVSVQCTVRMNQPINPTSDDVCHRPFYHHDTTYCDALATWLFPYGPWTLVGWGWTRSV